MALSPLVLLAISGSCGFPDYDFLPSSDDAGAGASGCDDGGCAAPPCPAGFGDCNAVQADGCETALTSLGNCGRCDLRCTNAHGSTSCEMGVCVPKCAAGYASCDLNPENGCEANVNTDPLNCGECGIACPANGGTPACQAGDCGIASCNAGFADCDNAGSCDFDLNTDPLNCGSCGHACSTANGSASCNGGACVISCNPGFGDCNSPPPDGEPVMDDGCETELNVPDGAGSVPNCGACGNACVRRAFTVIDLAQCAEGVCARNCFQGFGDCDNNRNTPGCNSSNCGCETQLSNNPSACGECGEVCPSGTCENSVCQ